MIKRLLAITTIAIAAMILASCDTTPEAAPDAPTRGIWDESTFVSAYFGLRFDLASGWTAMSDGNIASMFRHQDGNYEQIPQGSQVTPDMYEKLETLGIIDLSASGGMGTRGVTLRIGRFSDDEADMTALQFLENMVEEMSLPDTTEVVIHEDTMRIGAQDWYFASFVYDFRNEVAYNWYFVNVDGRFMRSIIVSHFGDGNLDETLELFRPY